MKKELPEILAPAGGKEQLKAAVRCGANAVYLGTGDFNARRNAENFSGDALFEAVKYCHSFGVKVYVALNTLVFDKECPALYKTVADIAKSGADAVIVQDFAAIKAVKDVCPSLHLHASTQMAVHNLEGALLLSSLGFSRAVLAREMSLEEIKAVAKNTSLETEVFVHGAHCMSVSGNCYISAMFGERSGNRGKCAQVCRLDWKSSCRNAALSLKDMSYLDSLGELKDAGVSSFKIEGRMKRPEYVAAAVESAKKALSGERYDKELLKSVFSRSGFTDGYLKGKRTADMFGFRQKEDVVAASPVLPALSLLYKDEVPRFPLDASLSLKRGEESALSLSFEGHAKTVFGEMPQEPQKKPLEYEIAEKSIKKLGGTPFYLADFKFCNCDSLTMPMSALNALRRDGVNALIEEYTKRDVAVNDVSPQELPPHKSASHKMRARLEKFSQYSDCFSDFEYISLPVGEILKNKGEISRIEPKIIAELPELLYPGETDALRSQLLEIKALGIFDAAVGNLGTLYLARELGFTLHGGHRLNITNSLSLISYEKLGLSSATLSFEMSFDSINALSGNIPRGYISYGFLPLMLFRVCPQKGENGCGGCNGIQALKDRKNIDFTLLCRGRKYSCLLNSVPLYLGDKKSFDTDFEILYFTKETPCECAETVMRIKKKAPLPGAKTSGIYYRTLI